MRSIPVEIASIDAANEMRRNPSPALPNAMPGITSYGCQCAGSDLFYSIQITPGTPGGKGQAPTPPKMKLEPTKPPEEPPPMPRR